MYLIAGLLTPIIIIILYIIRFKVKNPFWSHQPVVHSHSFLLKWKKPTVIWYDFYNSKFINPIQIITVPWEKLNHPLFQKHISQNFLRQKNITYAPSLEKHILPYFEKDNNAYASYYNLNNMMLGIITNRSLRVHIYGERFLVSYIDFLCVHKGHRRRNVAPELIQTHEYFQRTKSRKKCQISLFKKEGRMHNFVPLVKYNCFVYDLRKFSKERNILLPSLACVKINKVNIHKLINLLEHTYSSFKCFILPPPETLYELVEKNSIHIYVLLQVEQIISVYFFRETGAYMNSSKQNLECFASLNNSKDLDVFSQGFFIVIQKLIPKFKMLQIEELGHNTILLEALERKSIRYSYKTPCAYYLYNFSNREVEKEKICLLN
jgi:hypothetical protein